MGIPTSFISVVTSLDEAFIYGGCGVIYWGYAGTNTQPVCIEECNFVQCNVFPERGKWDLWSNYSVYLCVPLITFETFTRFLWNLVGRSCCWGSPQSLPFNSIVSIVPMWDHEIWVLTDLQRMNNFHFKGWTTFNKTIFVKN
jgi:hypothetical protein